MANRVTLILSLAILLLNNPFRCLALTKPSAVKLENNEYSGVVIAIHHSEPENEDLIDEIIEMVNDASSYLYEATNNRAFFKDVTILIPDTWPDKPDYQSPGNSTFEGADIIIAPRNPRFAPTPVFPPAPHTKHYEGCGKQAAYIHFTSHFLLNETSEELYGNKGRVLVHEWGHYRWGLFNEYPDPIGDPEHYKQLYFSTEEGKCLLSVCTRGWNTTSVTYNDDGTYVINTKMRSISDLFTCTNVNFIPNAMQSTTASIMSGYTNFPTVRKFCDDLETTDPSLEHNPEAPNKHNRLCNQRSCWSIMREHTDFKDANLPSQVTRDVTPSVVLARSKPKRVVLVLDTSGSMRGLNRISKLASVSRNFITNVVVDGSQIGIVQFNGGGIRLSGLTVVDSDDTRQILADLIPTIADGGTCIGCGLETALEILTENGMDAAGSLVVLVTDGQDGSTAKTNEVKNRYIEEGVAIDGVAFSNTAEENIVNLQIETGGKLFLQTDSPSSTGLYEAFQSTMESGIAENNRRIELHASSSTIEPNQVFSSGVYIDPTVGNNTLFDFSYFGGALDAQPLQIVITNPNGEVFDVSHKGYGEDLTFQIVAVRIPKTAVPGFWSYKVTNIHSSAIGVLITISTLASQDGVDPIIVSSELSGSITDFANGEPLIAFGEVRQGTYPIINVMVIATIERPPDPNRNPQDPVQIQLLDDGAGADVTKNDGIYSRYFTNFTGVGFYGIKLTFFNENGSAIILRPAELPFSRVPAYVDPQELLKGNIPIIDGTILPLPGIPVPEPDNTPAPSFSRGISGGSSRVPEIPENWSPGDDLFPPNAILDLIVTSSSYENETATLQFTAPGDDLDSGYASFYVIRVAESSNHFKNNGTSILPLNTTAIIQGNISSPKLSGEREVFVVRISIPAKGTMFSYHFAIHAVDNFGNQGDISNIASVTIDVPIPLTSTAPVTTELPSTTTTATVAATTAEPTEIPSTLQKTTKGYEPAVTMGLVGLISGITFILVIVVFGFFCLIYVVAKRRAKAIGHRQGNDHENGYADPHTVKNKVFTIKN